MIYRLAINYVRLKLLRLLLTKVFGRTLTKSKFNQGAMPFALELLVTIFLSEKGNRPKKRNPK